MKTNYLLPYRFKIVGWCILIPAIILGLIYFFVESEPAFLECKVFAISASDIFSKPKTLDFITNNIFDEIIAFLILLGALFVSFSKEKQEDEFISKLRLDSLLWATYINYAVLLLTIFFLYGFTFFWVLILNMFTILWVFIVRFNWVLYKFNKQIRNEE